MTATFDRDHPTGHHIIVGTMLEMGREHYIYKVMMHWQVKRINYIVVSIALQYLWVSLTRPYCYYMKGFVLGELPYTTYTGIVQLDRVWFLSSLSRTG